MSYKLIGAAAAVAVAALAVWFFALRDDDDEPSADTATTETTESGPTTTLAPLDEAGAELEALLASSRDATFHATYEATEPPQTEAGPALSYRVELFRSEGRTRQDTITELEAGTNATAGIIADGMAIICLKQGDADWACSESELADEGAADGIFGTIVENLGGVAVTATDEEIDGRDARCFGYDTADGAGSMCLTAEGIPVRLVGNGTELVLTELEDSVPGDAFEPPAEPVQAEPPS